MLGNIRFIGELGKLEVVNESILHKCIQQLLEKKKALTLTDQAEDLECLCQIMKTVGKRLDTPKAKLWMDQYFERMNSVQLSGEMPSRIRFLIQDVIEMRSNGWEPRKVARELTPQTITQIRQGYAPSRIENGMFGRSTAASGKNADADLYDIFGAPMASKAVGLGPGVISDPFRPNSPSGGRQSFNRQEQLGGWNDGHEKDKDWDGYREREQLPREKETRERTEYMGKSRDFQPRYGPPKMLSSISGGDKLSLRPGASLRPSFKPSSPHHLPKSARANYATAEPVRESPIFTKPQTPVIIKQEAKQKSKKQSEQKSGANKQMTGGMATPSQVLQVCEKLWTCEDVQETCTEISQNLKSHGVKSIQTKTIRQVIKQALNSETDAGCLLRLTPLLLMMREHDYIDGQSIEKILVDFVDEAERLEVKHPDIKLQMAELLYSAVSEELIELPVVCKLFVNGAGHPLALQFLRSLSGQKGEEWLIGAFRKHNLSCLQLLPVTSQSDKHALAVLEEYGLLCLEPMLELQRSLWEQINTDSNPASLFKWIMKNINEQQRSKDQFAYVLFKCLLRYVVSQTSMKEGADVSVLPDKQIQEDEKKLFISYQEILLRFLHESSERQLMALYSLQVFGHENNFPKGMMLRMFTYLYDQEIVDEEVFLKWKEDINEQYPGKGKALFQVNQWLTWLEQAESESDEE